MWENNTCRKAFNVSQTQGKQKDENYAFLLRSAKIINR
jgi:hypothetical protein